MAIFKIKDKKMDGSIKTREELKKQKGKSNKTWYFSVRYTDTFGNKKKISQ